MELIQHYMILKTYWLVTKKVILKMLAIWQKELFLMNLVEVQIENQWLWHLQIGNFKMTTYPHWFQMAFRVQLNFPRFPQLLAGLNNDFRVGHDVGNPQKWTLMNPSANMGSSLDTANLFTSKNWKMCTTEIGL